MKRSALFIIAGDPTSSPRPAEAVRIAAGVQAWQRINVHLYLHQPAAFALANPAKPLRDEALFRQCLPALATPDHPIYIPAGLGLSLDPHLDPAHCQEITEQDLAALVAQSTWVLYF